MCIELVFNAVTIALISFARYTVPLSSQEQGLGILLTGQVFAIFVITVAAAEVALGLAIVLAIYRNRQTVHITEMNALKK
jgi:NADH-quinone oxidoreductase subunit K